MSIRRIFTLAIVSGTVLSGCMVLRPAMTAAFGEARVNAKILPMGELAIPSTDRNTGYEPGSLPNLTDGPISPVSALVTAWANRDLPDWYTEGKVTAPRVILAKLLLANFDSRRADDIAEVNEYLANLKPWGPIGSTWELRPKGDYDFSLPPLTAIVYLFGDRPDVLYPETRDHIVDVLLTEEGDGFIRTVPGSLGLVAETENHILMTEGSRFLKNQWLAARGSADAAYNNQSNGMEEKLVSFIDEMTFAGSYEFNSTPYAGYTLMALLTLEAFADGRVGDAARRAIDVINLEYAAGSLELRRYAPYRRQRSRAGITDLTDHPHTSMMRVWVGLTGRDDLPITNNTHQALYAAIMPYRLPSEIEKLVVSSNTEHYVKIGRGDDASPEIYSAGEGFLISAGGTGRGKRSQIVARPITLMLADGATDLDELFRIGGEGAFERWNNTGVIHRAAVGTSPLAVPDGVDTIADAGVWKVFRAPEIGTIVAGADTGRVALLYLPGDEVVSKYSQQDGFDAGLFVRDLHSRCDAELLDAGRMVLPDGRTVTFDLDANRNTWVIKRVIEGESSKPVERRFADWPRFSGWIEDYP